jgi:flagellar biosynthetic protein FliQ
VLIMLIVSAPSILVSLVLGLAVALFSATTQIQEQTLSFVPKLIAVFAVLAATAGWMGGLIMRFTTICFTGFVDLLR